MQKLLRVISVILITIMVTSPPAFAGGGFSNSGSSSGGVSDDAYGAGWNGETSVAPSQNAVYDKVETIVAGGLDFALDSSSSGNIVYVGCSDSIATAAAAATSGDTLILGSCTYTVASTITVTSKALHIKGAEGGSTIINNTGTNIDTFSFVNPPSLSFSDITFTGADALGAIEVNCSTGVTCDAEDIVFNNITIDMSRTNHSSSMKGFDFQDSGYTINNLNCTLRDDSPLTSSQTKCVYKEVNDTNDKITYAYLSNSVLRTIVTNSATDALHVSRAYMSYNNGVTQSTFPSHNYIYNVVAESSADGVGDTASQLCQGGADLTNATYCYSYGGTRNGAFNETLAPSPQQQDVQCKEWGQCYFYGTLFINQQIDIVTGSNGAGFYYGILSGSNLLLGQGATPLTRSTSTGAAGVKLLDLTGSTGGATSIATTGTGGAGGASTVTLGVGGVADSAATASTGGAGGAFTLTAGIGGAASVAGTTRNGGAGGAWLPTAGAGGVASGGTTNNGGVGGAYTIKSGAGAAATGGTTATAGRAGHISILGGSGGSASGAGTTNTGGNGGSIYVVGGAAGTGATANGSVGNVVLGADSSYTLRGTVFVAPASETPVETTFTKMDVRSGSAVSNYSSSNPPFLFFNRGRGTQGTPTIISSGDVLGNITFKGYDGNSWESTAAITAVADTTVSDGAMPTALRFFTGATTSQSQKMAISSAGDVGIGVNPGTLGTAERLEILSANAQGPLIKHYRSDTSVSSGEVIGGQYYINNDSSLTTQNIFASVSVEANQAITTDAASADYKVSTTGSTAGGSPTLRHTTNERGFTVAMPSAQTIADTNTITADACGSVKNITSAGAVTTSTTNTFTASPSTLSCTMDVINVGSNNIVLDNNADFHTVGGADLTLGAKDSVRVSWNGTDWYQMSAVVDNT